MCKIKNQLLIFLKETRKRALINMYIQLFQYAQQLVFVQNTDVFDKQIE